MLLFIDAMTQEELDLTLFQLKKYFSSKNIMNLSSILKNLPSSTTSRIHMISFKNPNTALILSLLLGGIVGAFYVKKIVYGIVTLLLYILYLVFYILGTCVDENMIFVSLIFAIPMFVLILISIIKSRKWAFEYNYKLFCEHLQTL